MEIYRMMRIRPSVAVCLAMLVLAGCGEPVETALNEGEFTGPGSFFPYRPGDTYSFRVSSSSGLVDADTLVYVVRDDTVINGLRYYEHDLVASRTMAWQGSSNSSFYRHSGDSIMVKHPSEHMELPFALFNVSNSASGSSLQAYTFLQDTMLVLPVGKFHDVKHLKYQSLSYELFFAKNTGYIRLKLGGTDHTLIRARIGGRLYGH